MRTTVDIADDVLLAAKDFARRDNKTLGQTLSELARRALQMPETQAIAQPIGGAHTEDEVDRRFRAFGFTTLPSRGGVVTNELVNALREQEGV